MWSTNYQKKTLQRYLISINYHHAKLPEFRGVNSNGLELHKNKFYTYYSWHYMNEKIDKGFVFFKEKIKINKKIKHMFFYDIKKITSTSKKINKILSLAIAQKKINTLQQNLKIITHQNTSKNYLII